MDYNVEQVNHSYPEQHLLHTIISMTFSFHSFFVLQHYVFIRYCFQLESWSNSARKLKIILINLFTSSHELDKMRGTNNGNVEWVDVLFLVKD